MADTEDEITNMSPIDHIRVKPMWGGIQHPIESKLTLLHGAEMTAYVPAIIKIIDELLANASDATRAMSRNNGRIEVKYKKETGSITITNYGSCIPVKKYKVTYDLGTETKVVEEWGPQTCFCTALAGSNLSKDGDNVKGGTNGLGAKIANVNSKIMIIEIGDRVNKKLYKQKFVNRLRDGPSEPRITRYAGESYVKVAFIPAYEEFKTTAENEASVIWKYLYFRAVQISAYLKGPNVMITKVFNGNRPDYEELIDVKDLEGYIVKTLKGSVPDNTQLHTTTIRAIGPDGEKLSNKLSLEVGFVSFYAKKPSHIKNIAIINGICSTVGNIFTDIKNVLLRKLNGSKGSLTLSDVFCNTAVYVIGPIPLDNMWDAQNKEKISLPTGYFAEHYAFTKTFLNSVPKEIYNIAKSKKTKQVRKKAENYTKPSGKNWDALLVIEGISASTIPRHILGHGKKCGAEPSWNTCGIYCLKGVPPNPSRPGMKGTRRAFDGKEISVPTERLLKNVAISGLVTVLNLDYDKTYETQEEMDTLSYKRLIMCTDQDLDGIGKILNLIMQLFVEFWPALIINGFVQRWMTPVIRLIPKQNVNPPDPELDSLFKEDSGAIHFFYDEHWEEWVNAHQNHLQFYKEPEYFKGLAGHSNKYASGYLFNSFFDNVWKFRMDDGAMQLFVEYNGKAPSGRKKQLSIPLEMPSLEEFVEMYHDEQMMNCTRYLTTEVKAFKLDALKRQIPHIIDGMVESHRKIVWVTRKRGRVKEKVFQFASRAATESYYKHGDQSINGSVRNVASPGRLLKSLIPIGQHGTRAENYTNPGSDRYISVMPAVKFNAAMFRKEDDSILEYVITENAQVEPKYFVPVLPMVLVAPPAAMNGPSEGYMYCYFARDLDRVIELTKDILIAAIGGDRHEYLDWMDENGVVADRSRLRERELQIRSNGQDLVVYNDELYSIGHYTTKGTKYGHLLTIDNLPVGQLKASKIVENVNKLISKQESGELPKVIMDVNDYSMGGDGNGEISIQIELFKGGLKWIIDNTASNGFDPIINFFKLKTNLDSEAQLNFYNELEAIESHQYYISAYLRWFAIRKRFYKLRLTRMTEHLKLLIIRQTNIIKFIENASTYDLQLTDDAQDSLMDAEGYIKLNSSFITNPDGKIATEDMHMYAHTVNTSYNYLLNIPPRGWSDSKIKERKEKLAEFESQLEELSDDLNSEPIPGARIWLKEIEHAENVINEGLACNWWNKEN